MSQKSRSILKMIWTNFAKSLQPKKMTGDLKGTDHFGNKYFEITGDRSIGKKTTRWFQPVIEENYNQQTPAEWEAWLRYRRDNPPTQEELMKNEAISDLKKINAAKLEKVHHPDAEFKQEQIQTFPSYSEYEIMPGQHQDKDKEKK